MRREVSRLRPAAPCCSPISGGSASSALVADVDELGVALCHEVGCDAGAYSAVTTVLADTPDSEDVLFVVELRVAAGPGG
jgi:hypothetical protein